MDPSFNTCIKNLRKYKAEIGVYSADGVVRGANKVFEQAQMNCPVSTGALKASGKVSLEQEDRGNGYVGATISYGQPNIGIITKHHKSMTSDYAEQVHENPKSNGYKWLENAVNNNAFLFLDSLQNSLNTLFK